MSRNFPTNTATALGNQHVATVTFVKLEFSSGTLYLHNSLGTYVWGSQSWLGTGDLGNVSAVEEGQEISPYKLTLTLSGIDSTITNAALSEDYFMRPVTVYLGALDASDQLIDDPTEIWAGHMDTMTMTLGEETGDAVQLVCESELAKFDRASDLKYTDVMQQEAHSGDVFFNFLHEIQGAKIRWASAESDSVVGAITNPDGDGSKPMDTEGR